MRIIVAYTKNKRVIGKGGKLPWGRIEGDLPRFKRLTWGHPVIMGRKTWKSLPGNLPGRTNIVVTHTPGMFFQTSGFRSVSSFAEACELAGSLHSDFYVIGGESIYIKALMSGEAGEVIATEIHRDYEGDTFFSRLTGWKEHSREPYADHDLVIYRPE